ncbi:hypothetical protein PG996_003929 [Apiospora saccharicola]|uniref:CFEM domain-containing protein n=1 Tax=Apiospora saccharicola TaxID=335842 RepID=A0ABR1W2P8_9PEZI
MKSVSMMILGASALVSAQQMPDSFPKCGLICIPNMVNQASAFKCESGDWRCLCSSKNFIYGVRDCADQACPKQEEASAVKAFGKNQCAAVGIDIEGVPGSVTGSNPSATTTVMATGSPSASGSGSGSQSAVTTSDILSTMTTDGSTITSTVGQTTIFGGVAVPISTQDVLTTIESDGSSITSTIGKSTIFSTSGASGSESASVTQSGSASVTTNTSEVDTTVTTDGSTFTTKTQAESTSTTNPEAPSSTSGNAAAMKTVAPAGAFFAAAAAMFML